MNIGIIGIGGVGGYLGGILAKYYANSDTKIFFYCRGEHAAIIKDKGLTLQTQGEEYITRPFGVIEPNEESPKMDYLFIATKNYSILTLEPTIKGAIDDDTIIIPLMNGVDGSDMVKELFKDNRVWSGCVFIMSRIESAGIIVESGLNNNIFYFVGSSTATELEMDMLRDIITPASKHFIVDQNIDKRVWEKFAYISTLSTIATYYNANNGEIFNNAGRVKEFVSLNEEFLSIAMALNKDVRDDIAEYNLERALATPSTMTTSMQRDYYNGGSSEIDSLSGYIVRKGEELNITTPLYSKMYNKLRLL